tara:strand:- start:2896 stop:3918 length:1023 start_codon:yes stop_codon:yes gene_type:complete
LSDEFLGMVKQMLTAQDVDVSAFTARACREGGNNLVFEIGLGSGQLLAKKYYRSSQDPRDRLGAEWAFITYARALGLADVPATIARDQEQGIGLYEFVDGRKLNRDEIAPSHVEAAAQFFFALNGEQRLAGGESLPVASEACFSFAAHIDLIEQRLARLQAIDTTDDLSREAVSHVADLTGHWRGIRNAIEQQARHLQFGLRDELPNTHRCLSPSDFGFHNALVKPDGKVIFIDFEYSGWDDPAKMAADFFCQPQVPVPTKNFEAFLDQTMVFSTAADELKERSRVLLPAQKVKWACIMLNDFLPDAARRRQFANPQADVTARKRSQLDKTAAALNSLTN